MKSYSKSELEFLINEWVTGLRATRNKRILKDKLLNGITIPKIAEKYDMSETRIKTIIRTFKKKLDALEN
jgi:Mor family transcriptional regulator